MGNIRRIRCISYDQRIEIVSQNHKQGVRCGWSGGEIIVPIEYDKVYSITADLYQVYQDAEFGLFSTRTGGLVTPIKFRKLYWGLGESSVGMVGERQLMTFDITTHNVSRMAEYDGVRSVKTDYDTYVVRRDKKYGLVFYSLPEEFYISLVYDSIQPISWGNRPSSATTLYLVRLGQKYGLMEAYDNQFCLGTGGWGVNSETGKSDFGNDGLVYDEIRHIEDEWFLMRQGAKYGLFNNDIPGFIGDIEDGDVVYDEIRRVGKAQYMLRQDTTWRLLTWDNLTHPFSPPFDQLRKIPDGTFWFRQGDRTGIYDPEDGIDFDSSDE